MESNKPEALLFCLFIDEHNKVIGLLHMTETYCKTGCGLIMAMNSQVNINTVDSKAELFVRITTNPLAGYGCGLVYLLMAV